MNLGVYLPNSLAHCEKAKRNCVCKVLFTVYTYIPYEYVYVYVYVQYMYIYIYTYCHVVPIALDPGSRMQQGNLMISPGLQD